FEVSTTSGAVRGVSTCRVISFAGRAADALSFVTTVWLSSALSAARGRVSGCVLGRFGDIASRSSALAAARADWRSAVGWAEIADASSDAAASAVLVAGSALLGRSEEHTSELQS